MTEPQSEAMEQRHRDWARGTYNAVSNIHCRVNCEHEHTSYLAKELARFEATLRPMIEAEVVAWLREHGNIRCGEKMVISVMRDAGPHFADAIKRGDHRTKGASDV